jgi:pectinesterase
MNAWWALGNESVGEVIDASTYQPGRKSPAEAPGGAAMKTKFLLAAVLLWCVPAAAWTEKRLTVAADGDGDYRTVQEAIEAVPDNSPNRTVIHIEPGTYQGQVLLPRAKSNVTFEGDAAGETILTYDRNVYEIEKGQPRHFSGTGVVILADGFHADTITFQNTSGDHGQALALRIDGDRAILEHCRILGWQDTLMINRGRQYFKECYVEGRVDFIYGSATAVFDHCEIHSKNGGHITAASTPREHPFGFVFLDCRLTGDPAPWIDPATGTAPRRKGPRTPKADLGRPWRPHGCVAYLRCEMGDHIKPEGWDNWRNPANERTARFSEYKCTGPGADRSRRVGWSGELTDEEAARYTVRNILGDVEAWDLTQ